MANSRTNAKVYKLQEDEIWKIYNDEYTKQN